MPNEYPGKHELYRKISEIIFREGPDFMKINDLMELSLDAIDHELIDDLIRRTIVEKKDEEDG